MGKDGSRATMGEKKNKDKKKEKKKVEEKKEAGVARGRVKEREG